MRQLQAVKELISKDLLELRKRVKNSNPAHKPIKKTLSFKNLPTAIEFDVFFQNLNLPENSRFIYIFKFQNTEQAEKAKNLYVSSKKKRTDLAFSRINKLEKISSVFYVGSSKNIQARFKQHFGPKRTYSLHMNT